MCVLRVVAGIAVLAGAGLLAGCASSRPGSEPSRPGASTSLTPSRDASTSRPTDAAAGPIAAGPTTSADGTCPFIEQPTAANDVGVRTGRITVQTSGGRPVGCRFYADQDPAYSASEHLPGPDQPVLQISSSRYPSTTSAHNAMVRIAEAGSSARADSLSRQIEGISFQTRFYPPDQGRDWAYTFRVATAVVVVMTVQTDTSFDARQVAVDLAARF